MNRSRLFTRKLKRYLLFFAGRILLFLYAVFLYWRQREAVCLFLEYRNPLKFLPDGGRLPFLLIWALLLCMLLLHLFPRVLPRNFHTAALMKAEPDYAVLTEDCGDARLAEILEAQNRGARWVLYGSAGS